VANISASYYRRSNFILQIVQGVGVGVVLKKVSENAIMKWASFLLVWSYLSLVSKALFCFWFVFCFFVGFGFYVHSSEWEDNF
jgi:hypothetical protein